MDLWLISREIQDISTITKIILAVKSYHSAITLTLKRPDEQPFGPSYWKFNSGLLDDPSDVDLISTTYYDWVSEFVDVNDNRVPWHVSTK